jgi:HTH-type transcriptional regulator/antitoxin HipB
MKPKVKKLKTFTLDQLKDELIGKRGTSDREIYEAELSLEVLGDMIRATRLQRKLTQEQLGSLIGVQKAQISRLEKSASNVTIETVLKVFNALNAKANFTVELHKKSTRIA